MSNNPINKLNAQDSEMLFKVIFDILERGNDAEVKQTKNGIKVLEISKKIRVEITNG